MIYQLKFAQFKCFYNIPLGIVIYFQSQCQFDVFTLSIFFSECSRDYYKDSISNGKCIPCPHNSYSSSSRNSCLCKQGFYRTTQDASNESCSGNLQLWENILKISINEVHPLLLFSSPSPWDLYFLILRVTSDKLACIYSICSNFHASFTCFPHLKHLKFHCKYENPMVKKCSAY